MTSAQPPAGRVRGHDWAGLAVAGLLTGVSFLWLRHAFAVSPVTSDSARDFLWARDCLSLGKCHLIGATASVPGFEQGAVWPDLLILVAWFGGTSLTARMVVLSLLSVGVGTVSIVTWRWLRPAFAVPAAAFLLYLIVLQDVAGVLINPSASVFIDALYAATLLVFALTRRTLFLALAAVFLSLAVDTHVGAVTLIPSLAAIACLAGRRPLASVALAGGLYLLTSLITSAEALLANVLSTSDLGRTWLLLGGLVAVSAAGTALRPWYQRLGFGAKALVTGACLVGPFVPGAVWVIAQHHFGTSYLHPVAAPAAVLAAAFIVLVVEWVIGRGPRRTAVAIVLATLPALYLLLRLEHPPDERFNAWLFDDAEVMAEHFTHRGWTYPRVFTGLQGWRVADLLTGLTPGMDRQAPTPPDDPQRYRRLRLFLKDADAARKVPAGVDVIPLIKNRVAYVSEIDSWLDTRDAEICATPIAPGSAPHCELTQVMPDETGDRDFMYSHRPGLDVRSHAVQEPYRLTYSVAAHGVAGQSRDIEISDEYHDQACGWQIAQVTGLDADRPLPAHSVRLSSRDGAPGKVVFAITFGQGNCTNYPPSYLETTPDEAPLKAQLGGVP